MLRQEGPTCSKLSVSRNARFTNAEAGPLRFYPFKRVQNRYAGGQGPFGKQLSWTPPWPSNPFVLNPYFWWLNNFTHILALFVMPILNSTCLMSKIHIFSYAHPREIHLFLFSTAKRQSRAFFNEIAIFSCGEAFPGSGAFLPNAGELWWSQRDHGFECFCVFLAFRLGLPNCCLITAI